MIQDHPWRNFYKWAATQNPARHLWPVQTLRTAGRNPTPPHGMRWRNRDMGMDKTTHSTDATVRTRPGTHRLAPSPPTQIMAPTTTSDRPVDTSKFGTVQDATAANSNTTRLPRLPTPGEVEDIPEERPGCTGRKLPRGPLNRQDATNIGWWRKNWQWRGTDNGNIHTDCQQSDMHMWPSSEVADPDLRRRPVRVLRKRPIYTA